MDIRLKNKVKKYFNNVWLIEILLVIVITGICMDALIKYKNSPSTKSGTGVIEAVFDRSTFCKNSLKADSKSLSKDIYDRTDGLKKLLY